MTSTQHTPEHLDRILGRIQGLLANAEDKGNTPEAQEAYRLKAEALMFTYRVEENQIAQSGGAMAESVKPVWRKIWISRTGTEFSNVYYTLAHYAASHVGAEYSARYERNPEDGNRSWMVMDLVGYEGDLRFAELLWASMHLAFSGKMEPKVNPELSDAENAYILRSAGMEGRKIAALLWGDDSKPNRVKARKLFAQWAAEHGEDPSVLLGRGNSVKTFRESYGDGFLSEISGRLWRMRQSHGDKEIALAGRREAILEALYEKYPSRRPSTEVAKAYVDPRKDCPKCQKASSGYCRDHQYLKPRAGRYVERAFSSAGYSRGGVAARSVDLGSKGTSRVGGSDRRSIG